MGDISTNTFTRMFKPPTPPSPQVPDLATPPSLADPAIAAIGARARARLASLGGMGFADTLKTGGKGAKVADVTKAALTGTTAGATT